MGILGFGSKDKNVGPITSQRTVARFARVGDKMVELDPVTKKPIAEDTTVVPKSQPSTAVSGVATAPNSTVGDSATFLAVEKPTTAPLSPAAAADKTGGASERGSSSVDVSMNVGAGHRNDDADQAAEIEDAPKTIPINEEYLRKLYAAVEDNLKQAVEMISGFNALVDMIQDLNADTVDLLGKKSALLETANADLERLKAEEVDRLRVVDRLNRENSKLKDKCEAYDITIEDKDAQIARATSDLKAVQEKCDAKDGEIAALNKARHDADIAHDEEMAKLKAAHDTEMADLSKKHAEEVEALNRNAADQIESVRKSVDEFVPARVCDLFDYRVGEQIDDRSRWQAIYAYLGFINGNLRQDAFVRRFREFDAALYDAMRDSPDQLAECRVRVQRHINEEVGKKAGGLLVCWPKAGEACNPDHYTTMSDFGQRISEVIGAMIYKMGDGGKVLCQSKGKVATA